MKINNVLNNLNFKGVYLVANKDNQLNKLKNQLDAYNGFYRTFGVCDFHIKNQVYQDRFEKAKQEGKDVTLFVTGAKDCTNIMMNEKGWNSVKDLVQKAEIFFDLSDDNYYCVTSSLSYDNK